MPLVLKTREPLISESFDSSSAIVLSFDSTTDKPMNERPEPESVMTAGSSRLPTPDGVSTRTKLFSGLDALGWSAGVAVLTALATCAGMIRESGKFSALALYPLSHPAIDQRDTYKGMSCLLSAILVTLLAFAVAYSIYLPAMWVLRKTPLHGRLSSLRSRAIRFLSWTALIIVLVDVVFLNTSIVKLADQAEGLVLKHASDAGTVWPEILLDEDFGAASGYIFVFGAGMATFIALSWWLIDTRAKRRLSKVAFSFWAGAQVLLLLLGYSYLIGVTDTIGQFPIVVFSGSEQLVPHSCALLLGSDDKQFAFLIVNCQEKSEQLQKYVLYLPRTEVKWMTVIRVAQLQPLARLDDLKKLSQQDTN